MTRREPVVTGLEALVSGRSQLQLPRRNLGLLSNPSAILPDGSAALDALQRSRYEVTRLFGPEHGYLGTAQDAVHVQDGTYRGIETVSLYGARQRPDASHLSDLEAVLIDIQDIGCRYYTYVYTAAALIEACEREQIPVIVLDRPNPISGLFPEGGPISRSFDNEVGRFELIQRHAMTVGEVCRYLRNTFFPQAKLTVLPLLGWERSMCFLQTSLPWKQPSPNLPTPDTAIVYPGTCLFEGTNISEGRGTTRPFETIGAPWIDAERLRDSLNERSIPGAVFSATSFVPTFSKFAGEMCHGVQIHVTDCAAFRPLRAGVDMLLDLCAHSGAQFQWRPLWENPHGSFFDYLAGSPEARTVIDRGGTSDDAYAILTSGNRAQFDERRAHALLYEQPTEPSA